MKGDGGPERGASQGDTPAAPPGEGSGVPISRNAACFDGDLGFTKSCDKPSRTSLQTLHVHSKQQVPIDTVAVEAQQAAAGAPGHPGKYKGSQVGSDGCE